METPTGSQAGQLIPIVPLHSDRSDHSEDSHDRNKDREPWSHKVPSIGNSSRSSSSGENSREQKDSENRKTNERNNQEESDSEEGKSQASSMESNSDLERERNGKMGDINVGTFSGDEETDSVELFIDSVEHQEEKTGAWAPLWCLQKTFHWQNASLGTHVT